MSDFKKRFPLLKIQYFGKKLPHSSGFLLLCSWVDKHFFISHKKTNASKKKINKKEIAHNYTLVVAHKFKNGIDLSNQSNFVNAMRKITLYDYIQHYFINTIKEFCYSPLNSYSHNVWFYQLQHRLHVCLRALKKKICLKWFALHRR